MDPIVSSIIIDYDEFIECSKCDLEFDKEFLGVIPDEDILARQELMGIANSLMDLELKNKRKISDSFEF